MQMPNYYEEIFPYSKVSRTELNLFLNSLNGTCKYRAYKCLWNQGYYLTCGAKFGGDFLVYPGRPSIYHSQFILICSDRSNGLTLKELVTYSRVATSVKKTFAIAMFIQGKKNDLETRELFFNSFNWAHM